MTKGYKREPNHKTVEYAKTAGCRCTLHRMPAVYFFPGNSVLKVLYMRVRCMGEMQTRKMTRTPVAWRINSIGAEPEARSWTVAIHSKKVIQNGSTSYWLSSDSTVPLQ